MTSTEKSTVLDQISRIADVQNDLDKARISLYRLKMEGFADNIRDLQHQIDFELGNLRGKLNGADPVQPTPDA